MKKIVVLDEAEFDEIIKQSNIVKGILNIMLDNKLEIKTQLQLKAAIESINIVNDILTK